MEEGELEERAPEVCSPPECPSAEADGDDEERVLAALPSSRAPYFYSPGCHGYLGRLTAKQRKKLKKQAKAGFVDVYGSGATASLELHQEAAPIRLRDVQGLVQWVLADGVNPRWCFVKNKPLVRQVVLLAAHGVHAGLWEEDGGRAEGQQLMPAWRRLLGQPIELQARNAVMAPGQSVHSLFTVPQPKKRRREEGGEGQQAQHQQQLQSTNAAAASLEAAVTAVAASGEDMHAAPHGLMHTADAAGPAAAAAGAAAEEAGVGGGDAPPTAPGRKRAKLAAGEDVGSWVAPAELAEASQQAQHANGSSRSALPAEGALAAAAAATNGSLHPAAAAAGAPPHAAAAATPTTGRGLPADPPLPPSAYVLTLEQLAQHGYPLPVLEEGSGEMACPEGYVATSSCGGEPQHQLVALDCEMCITEAGFELTRATLVDAHGQVLLDELVVPHNPITDYNTRYSGITAEMLAGVSTRIEDVQRSIRGLVASETLLVAHSGENDLKALKVIHANVVDTSVLFPHPKGGTFKSALRVLASRFLMRTIQTGEHDPVEDARAALDLALLKIARGPTFGCATGERGERLADVLSTQGRRSTLVDRTDALTRLVCGNCSGVAVADDAAAVEQLCRVAARGAVGGGGADFLWGQLLSLHEAYQDRVAALEAAPLAAEAAVPSQEAAAAEAALAPDAAAEGAEGAAPASGIPGTPAATATESFRQQQAAAIRGLDSAVERLHASLQPGALLIVVCGQGDTACSRWAQEQKWRRQQGLDGLPPWSQAAEAHLAAAGAAAMRGLCFATVKGAP